jgi:hypothetical protein
LRGTVTAVVIDDERLTIRAGGRSIAVEPGLAETPSLRVRTSRSAVRSILSGDTALVDAVKAGSLQITGSMAQIAAAHDAILCFIHGAVRSATIPRLLARFEDVDAPRGTDLAPTGRSSGDDRADTMEPGRTMSQEGRLTW